MNNSTLELIRFRSLTNWNIKNLIREKSFSSQYPLKPIGFAIKRIKDQMVIKDEETYKRITIKTNCGGVVVRDEVLGSEIKTKKQFYVRKGQLAVSKIDARNGAFGIIPVEADGAVITGNFWVYDVDADIANIVYLTLVLSSDVFVKAWQACSNGSGNRLYLQEDMFLNYKIPFPSLEEQNQIVNRYIKKINKAQSNYAMADNDNVEKYISKTLGLKWLDFCNTSSSVLNFTNFKDMINWSAITNFITIKPADIFKSEIYENKSILNYCQINPITKLNTIDDTCSFIPMESVSDKYGELQSYKKGYVSKSNGYTKFLENDILWAKITPCMQNGKSAVAKNLINGCGYGSTEFHIFRCNDNILPEFLHILLRTKRIREVAMRYFTGSSGQQRVGVDFLENLTIPCIPIESKNQLQLTQKKIVLTVKSMNDEIKKLNIEAKTLIEQAKKEFEETVFCEA